MNCRNYLTKARFPAFFGQNTEGVAFCGIKRLQNEVCEKKCNSKV